MFAWLTGCLLLDVKMGMSQWLTGMTPAGLMLCLHTEVLILHQVLGHVCTLTELPVLISFACCKSFDALRHHSTY